MIHITGTSVQTPRLQYREDRSVPWLKTGEVKDVGDGMGWEGRRWGVG